MNTSVQTREQRFGRAIERRDGADFPFYDFIPVEVATWKWLAVIASCIVGFLVLVLVPFESQYLELIPRIFFTALPLVVFSTLVRPQWRAIFRPIRLVDVGSMFVFWALNLVVAMIMGLAVRAIFGANADAAIDGLASMPIGEKLAFFAGSGIQILGEELFTILPFLALLYWLHRVGMRRNSAVLIAWVLTAIWFGLAHLPAYGWNIAQVLLVIGVSRLILTLAYIRTKNIWVSTGAHVLHDWISFAFVAFSGIGTSLLLFTGM